MRPLMNRPRGIFALLGGAAVAGLAWLASAAPEVATRAASGSGRETPTPKDEPAPCQCSFSNAVNFGPAVPGDGTFNNQDDANCFGWAEFVALNWPTNAGAGFGDPGDKEPVQWETYMPMQLLFQPGAATPPPWGTLPPIPADCQQQIAKTARGSRFLARGRQLKLISAVSKFTVNAGPSSFPSLIGEAAPANGPNWLGAQNGTNAWFEVRISQDEYEFVAANSLYNADAQAAWVAANKPIVLPKGQANGPVGSIELKAAWMEVPEASAADPKWSRYKLSEGVVVDPTSGQCRVATLALVGLHIIHKTAMQPTWVWATFEQVDNVPGPGNTNGSFNFNNPACQTRQVDVPAALLPPNVTSPVTVGCTPNVSPPYYLGSGGPEAVPIQVTRVTPIASGTKQINQKVQNAIVQNYPKSVWQYYQLVNVVWSNNAMTDPTVPKTVPLNPTGLQPPGPVANTTLETYAQQTKCTDCHQSATIAPTAANPKPQWDSDFSFALGTASSPPPANAKSLPR